MQDENKSETQSNRSQNELDFNYSLLDLIGVFYRWRKPILILIVVAMIGSIVISLLLPNYYTATATFVPANEEKELFNAEGTKNNSLYGDEDAIDRSMIFSNSPKLIEYMITTYQLAERYDIDASTPKGQDRVVKTFIDLYEVKKNEHIGIEVSIQDKNPMEAAKMLQGALDHIQLLHKDATKNNKALIKNTYEQLLTKKKAELDSASREVSALRLKYSIWDVEEQGELMAGLVVRAEAGLAESKSKLKSFTASGQRDSIRIYKARVAGLSRKLESLTTEVDSLRGSINIYSFNEGKDKILYYETIIEELSEDVADINTKYSQFDGQANNQASSIIILEPVQVPKIKSYPIRWLIVAASTILAAIFGLLGALLFDLYKKVNWNNVLHGKS
ncbi:MAG: Wzz/FepE/Etk N-terminal domain-containing protein [Saprospiraceae bacterium]|nr:Wzz/FepE/Etk N-terminal domain-containing protein [Saprospiraceae bacterium]